MPSTNTSNDTWTVYRTLMEEYMKGGSGAALFTVVFRLMVEVEALREALSSPDTPESVRQSYRQAYERIATLAHNAAGSGGTYKVLDRFLEQSDPSNPKAEPAKRFAPELAMMKRLGASPEEQKALREKLEEVEMYT